MAMAAAGPTAPPPTAPAPTPSPHPALALVACLREPSPAPGEPPTPPPVHTDDDDRHEAGSKKRRFHPLRGLRRMFRRKVRAPGATELAGAGGGGGDASDAHRSRSASELLAAGDDTGPGPRGVGVGGVAATAADAGAPGGGGGGGGGLFPGPAGLSVSHDSVFTAESGGGGGGCSDANGGVGGGLDGAPCVVPALSVHQLGPGVRAELLDAVRRRGRRQPGAGGGRRASVSDDERGGGAGDADDDPDDDDVDDDEDEEEEDLGLPRSPCNSPTTADVLLEKGIKELPTQSHSTCSDGSLLSMGSSEMDEDSIGQHSGHSSKLSLHDKKMLQDPDPEPELELRISGAPLSHSAARHKMAVRPRRTHGAPRRSQRLHQLPATPEVLEEGVGRASSPETKSQTANQSQASSQRTAVTASESPARSASALGLHAPLATSTPTGVTSGSNAAAAATGASGGPRVTRSRSNAAARQREPTTALTPPPPPVTDGLPDEPPPRESFFSRILRSSGRRKKERDEGAEGGTTALPAAVPPKRMDERGRYAQDAPTPAPAPAPVTAASFGPRPLYRSTAAARQRVEPINLPPSPEASRGTQAPPPPRPAWPEPPVPAPRRTLLAGSPPKTEDTDRACLSLFAAKPQSETDGPGTRTPVKKAHSFRAELSAGTRGLSLGNGTAQPEIVEKVVPPPGVVPATRHFAKHTHVSSTRLGDDGGGSRPRRLKHKSASLDSISSGGGGSAGSAGSGGSPGPTLKSASIDSVDCVAATAVGAEGAVTVRVRTVSEHKSEPELPAASPTGASAPITVLTLPVSADDSPASVTVAVAATASVTVPVPAPVTTPAAAPVFVSEPVTKSEEPKAEPKPELVIETKRQATPEPEVESTGEKTPEPHPVQEKAATPPTTPPPGRDRTPSPEALAPTASPEPVVPEVPVSEPLVEVSETSSESTAPSVMSNGRVPHRRESRPTPAPEPSVPEFFRVRLNRVDSRPAVNVVLSTGAGGALPRGRLRSADDAVSAMDSSTNPAVETEPKSRRVTLAGVRASPPPSLATPSSLPFAFGDSNGDAHSLDETPGKATVKEETVSPKRPEDAAVLVKVLRKGEDERSGSTKEVLSFRKGEDTFTKLLNSRRKDSEENGITVELSPTSPQKRIDDAPVFVKAIRKKEEEPPKVEKEESAPVVTLRKAEDVFGKILRRKDEEQPKEVSAIVVAEATAPPPRKIDGEPTGSKASSILLKKKEDVTPPSTPTSTQERPKTIEDASPFFPSRVFRRRDDDHHPSDQQPQGRRLRLKSSEDDVTTPTPTPGKRPDVVTDVQPRKKSNVGVVDADGPLRAKTDVVENGVALRKKSQPQLQTLTQQEDTSLGSSTPEVVLRRKSTAREVGPKREEEPELLKVFARRSLKLKDPETEMMPLSAPSTVPPVTNGTNGSTRPPGRDSDKENEGGDSPREERRGKVSSSSAPSVQSAPPVVTAPVSTMGSRVSTTSARGGGGVAARSFGGGGGGGAPEESAVLVVCQKENTAPMAVTEPATAATKNADDAVTPQFKRIQQRKEEWELRAQAARKALP